MCVVKERCDIMDGKQIIKSLKDALDYIKGDKTKAKSRIVQFELMADTTDQEYIENNPKLKQKIIDGLNTPIAECTKDEEW